MKTSKNLQNSLFNITLLVTMFFVFSSCGETKNQEETDDSKEVAEEKNEETFETRASEKDAQFLVNAAEIGMNEVKLAQLALSKSKNTDVKDLATMMETQHTASNSELKELALKKGVTIPMTLTEKGEETYKKLNEKEGKEFDMEYCDMMVKGHKDAIKIFERASTDVNDTDIRNWAALRGPTLRDHLKHSEMCKEKCDKMK